jgi:hypothetical protein
MLLVLSVFDGNGKIEVVSTRLIAMNETGEMRGKKRAQGLRYLRRIIQGALIVGLLAPPLSATGATFTLVADTQTAVPGGTGTFSLFGDARAIEGGRIVFVGLDSAVASGIYSYQAGLLNVVADTNTIVPGTSDTFSDFFDVASDRSTVAFTAGWPGPGGGCSFSGSEGVFTRRFQGGSIRAIATSLTTDRNCFEGIDFEEQRIAVSGGVNPVDLFHNHSESIMTIRRIDRPKVLVDTTTPKPGGGTFIGYDQDTSLSGGNLLFTEIIANTLGAVAGIYTIHGNGNALELVADQTTPVPGGTGNFNNFAGVDWDGIEVGFVGRNSGNAAFLYAGASPTDLRVVVNSSTQVPGEGGATFAGVGNPIAYEGGVFVFEGFWSGSKTGLFTSTAGVVIAILKKGDILNGHTVSDAFCRPQNKSGNQLLIKVVFSDNTSGLYLVDL